MRMKFNKSSQLLLVSAAGLMVASLLTACSQFTQTLTVDFFYLTSSKAAGPNNYGEVNIFEINSESGQMRQIPASPVPSQGRNPVAEAVSADYANLFVANQDDNNIVQFVIGSDGKLYPYYTVNTPGIFPLALAANASNLFVVDTYQPLSTASTAHPCSGSIAVFPLTTATSSTPVTMQAPATNSSLSSNYWPLAFPGTNTDTTGCTSSSHVLVPTSVNVLHSGNYVYVAAYDSSVTPTVGYVFGFTVGSGGVLTPMPGSPFAAGVKPSGIASDPTSKYVYVTDYTGGNVLGFSVASGALLPLSGSPYPAGNGPSAIVVDQSFGYAYVTNFVDSNVTAYSYSVSNGMLSRLGTTYPTGLQPAAIGIDPSTFHFLFTANFLGNNVSGFELSQTAGTLLISQNSPFPTNAQPTAVAAIPHNGTGAGVH
jgi:6-phosphogluconolactonase (cycloisomerase 2 family)